MFWRLVQATIFQVVPVEGQLCCSAIDALAAGAAGNLPEGFPETGNNDSITSCQLLARLILTKKQSGNSESTMLRILCGPCCVRTS